MSNALRVTSLTISLTDLTIGGSGTPGTQATWTAIIENPKKQSLTNVYIQTSFVVYLPGGNISGWRSAGGALIQCPGRSPGVLPSGTCTISGTATPSNDAGGGGVLVPDDINHDAKFELELRQRCGYADAQAALEAGGRRHTLLPDFLRSSAWMPVGAVVIPSAASTKCSRSRGIAVIPVEGHPSFRTLRFLAYAGSRLCSERQRGSEVGLQTVGGNTVLDTETVE